ncbi:MAG: hypothetical protein U0R77_11390 [Mycolicibacterium insubricum]|nr:hypothetical protein [Mycolicibacterium insubricum]
MVALLVVVATVAVCSKVWVAVTVWVAASGVWPPEQPANTNAAAIAA